MSNGINGLQGNCKMKTAKNSKDNRTTLRYKNVYAMPNDKGKNQYFYIASKSSESIRLPDDYGSKEFLIALNCAIDGYPYEIEDGQIVRSEDDIIELCEDAIFDGMKRAKLRAQKNGWDFDLDLYWLGDLLDRQNFKCAITGIQFFTRNKAKTRVDPYRPSIDRIDSSNGYTKDNVRIVAWVTNMMLLDWGDNILDKTVRAYVNHNKRSKTH